MSILSNVNEIEDRVVDKIRTLQQPVVEYVRKGIEEAEARLPKLTYPENLPKPAEVVESGFNFAKTLLETQREFVSGLVDAVTPLVRPDGEAKPEQSEARSESTESAESEAAPAPKTKAAPAKAKARSTRSTAKRSSTKS